MLKPGDPETCPTCAGPLEVQEIADSTEPSDARQLINNEAIFRGINEQLRAQAGELSQTDWVEFVCECGRLDCDGSVYLTEDEYAKVRKEELWFFTLPGHEEWDARVVERSDRYVVIDKRPLIEGRDEA